MVRTAVDGDIATVVLDDEASQNRLTASSLRELTRALEAAERAPGVRAGVVTHTGAVFSAGADLTAGTGPGELVGCLVALVKCCWTASKPLVARVDGAVRGGGLCLLAACDVVVASERSTFAAGEVRLGMAPRLVAPLLRARLGPRAASRFVLGGTVVAAAEAHRLGLVTVCAPAKELDDYVARELHELRQAAPGAQAVAKELLWGRDAPELFDALDRVTAEAGSHASGEEIDEGIAAFRERRRPRWARCPGEGDDDGPR